MFQLLDSFPVPGPRESPLRVSIDPNWLPNRCSLTETYIVLEIKSVIMGKTATSTDELIEAIRNADEGEILIFDESDGFYGVLQDEVIEAARRLERLEDNLADEDGLEDYRQEVTDIRSDLVSFAQRQAFNRGVKRDFSKYGFHDPETGRAIELESKTLEMARVVAADDLDVPPERLERGIPD